MVTRKSTLVALGGIVLLVTSVLGRPGPDKFHHHGPLISPPRTKPVIIRPPHGVLIGPTIILTPPATEEAKKEKIVVWITNNNGSKSPVTLIKEKDGPGYIGPKGEYYSCMPTEEQLKVLYAIGAKIAQERSLTVWITNDNGSKTPVTLTPSGTGFFGPAGEYYSSMPMEEQLKVLYGLRSKASDEKTITVWFDNDGVRIPVVLTKESNQYVGPSGEYYQSIPTEEQLKMVYGAATKPAEFNSVTIWIENDDGSKMPVTLQKEGSAFIGPAGEKYSTLPTKEQLRLLYGSNTGEKEQSDLSFVITNNNGQETVVTLKKEGSEFVGPKGERYPSIPTEEQLKLIYGK